MMNTQILPTVTQPLGLAPGYVNRQLVRRLQGATPLHVPSGPRDGASLKRACESRDELLGQFIGEVRELPGERSKASGHTVNGVLRYS